MAWGDFLASLGSFFGGGSSSSLSDVASTVAPVAESFGDAGGAAGTFTEMAPSAAGAFGDVAGSTGSVGSAAPWPTAPPGGAAPGGWGGDLLTGFGRVAKAALPAAQLGLAGMGLASAVQGGQQLSRQTKIAEQAGRRQSDLSARSAATAAPVNQYAGDALARVSRGELDPGTEAEIERKVQGWKTIARDRLARSGQGDSSALDTMEREIDGWGIALRAAALRDLGAGGVAAAGTAGNILAGAGQAAHGAGITAGQQQGSLQQLIAQANAAMNQIGASAA